MEIKLIRKINLRKGGNMDVFHHFLFDNLTDCLYSYILFSPRGLKFSVSDLT